MEVAVMCFHILLQKCVKLRKNENDTPEMLSKAYGGKNNEKIVSIQACLQ
jgi:hypothetical protein